MAVHAPRELVERLRIALAEGALDVVTQSANAMLPRANLRPPEPCRPVGNDDGAHFDNGLVHAFVNRQGAVLELVTPHMRVPVSQANLLTRARPMGFEAHDQGARVQFQIGKSPATMELELRRGEPFLRVALAVDWCERWRSLQLENWFAIAANAPRYGDGKRFAAISDERAGVAIFAVDPLGWDARALRKGGMHLTAELLRERGSAQLAWAFAPFEPGISIGALEQAWELFAYEPRVRLFTSEDPAIRVVETTPAVDGDGVIVRVRECDGIERSLRLRCGARMREVDGEARIEGEAIIADIGAFGERSFRVRF
ncbi:MAG TPA: hypothetical protein VMB20_03255 [Candidatus Acidoferrum sp.]|nr:hypothetical protein [Candidatus Acidoferrum sp.]